MQVKISELQLADIVCLGDGPYMIATVQQIDEEVVTFYRPYVHTEDFSYTGGVIVYVGTETCTRSLDSTIQVELLERRAVSLK